MASSGEHHEANHLFFAGHDVVALAERFGTPLYIYDEPLIRRNIGAYRDTLRSVYPNSQVFYAGKAFLTTAMARLLGQEGIGLDAVSGGELVTAFRAGLSPEQIIFNGNNKTPEEMALALRAGVGRIIVDSLTELEVLEELAARYRRRPRILIRINPGVEAHTHEYVQTGITDCKFGLGASDGLGLEAVRMALAGRRLQLAGFHCHIGSQIFDLNAFRAAVAAMGRFIETVRQAHGYLPGELDMGGGLGIRYLPGDPAMDIPEAVRFVAGEVEREFAGRGWPQPFLLLEPGRSIVGEAGLAVYRVGVVKQVPGARTYVALDGGMADNPRVALYGAEYRAVVANRVNDPESAVVTLAGRCCESGDLLARDVRLAKAGRGDLVAVFSAGAYQYSMASNYNRIGRPAVVFAHSRGVDLVARRETADDVLRLDVVPERLARSNAQKDLGGPLEYIG